MFFVLTALLLGTPAFAQDRPNVVEDRIEVGRDIDDLERLNLAIDAWQIAVERHDRGGERAADAQLTTWLRGEIVETGHEVREDRRELRGARLEARGPGRDDDRDRVGDRVDLVREQNDKDRLHEVAVALKADQPKFESGRATAADYAVKRGRLDELQRLSRTEIARSHGEVREDRNERGERH